MMLDSVAVAVYQSQWVAVAVVHCAVRFHDGGY